MNRSLPKTKYLLVSSWIFVLSFWAFGVLPASVLAPSSAASSCGDSPRANGLVTSPSLDTSVGVKFGTTAGSCVTNTNEAALPTFQIQSYDDLRALYYDQFKAHSGVTKRSLSESINLSTLNPINFSGDNIWFTNLSNFNIPSSGITGSGTQVIFIDGELEIQHDINYHTGNAAGGLVFIVKGNINIDASVHQIDAYLISGQTICTGYDFGSNSCPGGLAAKDTVPLVINGGLVSLNNSTSIRFRRDLTDNSTAAEQVNYDPKYLYLLKGMVSQSLSITTQNTNFAPTPAPLPTRTAFPTSTPACVPPAC